MHWDTGSEKVHRDKFLILGWYKKMTMTVDGSEKVHWDKASTCFPICNSPASSGVAMQLPALQPSSSCASLETESAALNNLPKSVRCTNSSLKLILR